MKFSVKGNPSTHAPDSESPEMSELERDILEKYALDEEICRAAQKQRQGTAQNVSPPSECTVPSDGDESDNDQSLAFAESLFFKSKGKNKKPLASTPVLKRREADLETKLPGKRAADAAERPSKKGTKKKGKGYTGTGTWRQRAEETFRKMHRLHCWVAVPCFLCNGQYKTDNKTLHLPSCFTQLSVYQHMCKESESFNAPSIGISQFYTIFREEF